MIGIQSDSITRLRQLKAKHGHPLIDLSNDHLLCTHRLNWVWFHSLDPGNGGSYNLPHNPGCMWPCMERGDKIMTWFNCVHRSMKPGRTNCINWSWLTRKGVGSSTWRFVCWGLKSLCHSNGHIETMPAREINPFNARTRIRSQFLRTQWSTSNHQRVNTTTP